MTFWNMTTGKHNWPSKERIQSPWWDLLNICTNCLAEEAVPPLGLVQNGQQSGNGQVIRHAAVAEQHTAGKPAGQQ